MLRIKLAHQPENGNLSAHSPSRVDLLARCSYWCKGTLNKKASTKPKDDVPDWVSNPHAPEIDHATNIIEQSGVVNMGNSQLVWTTLGYLPRGCPTQVTDADSTSPDATGEVREEILVKKSESCNGTVYAEGFARKKTELQHFVKAHGTDVSVHHTSAHQFCIRGYESHKYD